MEPEDMGGTGELVTEEQPGDNIPGSEGEAEQPAGEDQNIEQEETVDPESLESLSIEELKELGFKSRSDLMKALDTAKHAQQKITELGQGKSRAEKELEQLRQNLGQIGQNLPAGQQPFTGPMSQEDRDKLVDSLLADPVGFIAEHTQRAIEGKELAENQFGESVGTSIDSALGAMKESGMDFSALTEDEQAAVSEVLNTPFMQNLLRSNVTVENVSGSTKEELDDFLKSAQTMIYRAARGIVADRVVHGAEAEARRNAKKTLLNKTRGRGVSGGSGTKPVGAPPPGSEGKAYLGRLGQLPK